MGSERTAWAGPVTDAILGGRYRLRQRIGRGGMADVWRADDPVLQRSVAVKLFRFDTPAADQPRVQAEMRTLAGLQHPGIVTVYDAGTVPDPAAADDARAPYLVMELVDGRTLAERITAGPLPAHEAAEVGRQLAAALAYVHSRGIVHRDVKPANVLMTADRPGVTVKLTDFGIARLADAARHTATGFTLGTPNYLAPEQAAGSAVGPAADVYALGLVLLEALTGAAAFPGAGVEAALARLHRPPHVPPELGAGWAELLAAMTALEPEHRPSAAQVATRLTDPQLTTASPDARTQMLGAPVAPGFTRALPTFAPAPGSGHRRRPPWLLLAAVGVAIAVVVIVLVATSGGGGRSPGTRPSYPAVSGSVGQHLRQLESAVG